MSELAVVGPLSEGALGDQPRLYPMNAASRHIIYIDGRLTPLDRRKFPRETAKCFRVESRPDAAGVNQLVALIVAEKQGAQSDPASLWLSEAD